MIRPTKGMSTRPKTLVGRNGRTPKGCPDTHTRWRFLELEAISAPELPRLRGAPMVVVSFNGGVAVWTAGGTIRGSSSGEVGHPWLLPRRHGHHHVVGFDVPVIGCRHEVLSVPGSPASASGTRRSGSSNSAGYC